ncbi:MAG: 3-methyl-2-oxobutanoate dehydrogenase subunit beta, partial [Candidatus Brocadiales bacterium]
FMVVEMSAGQMVEDVKLSILGRREVYFYGRTGGGVPSTKEILNSILEVLPKIKAAAPAEMIEI